MRTSVLLFVPFFAACQESAVTKFNANPTAVITSHVDGDTVREDEPELIVGQVGDPDNDVTSLNINWTVAGAEVCTDSTADEDGTVSCEATFEAGGGAVVLSVSDADGAAASASIELDVQASDAPVATLSEPTEDGEYFAEQSIAFQGTVSDTEDAVEDLTVTIETEASGDLGLDIEITSDGSIEAYGTLPEGEHVVRLRVVDTDGKEGLDSAVINVGPVPTDPPVAALTSPTEDGEYFAEESIAFQGTVSDTEDAVEDLTVTIETDALGDLGLDIEVTSSGDIEAFGTLPEGEHAVRLRVVDTDGNEGTDSVIINVGPVVTDPPVVNITAPTAIDRYYADQLIAFAGTVSDTEDAVEDLTVTFETDDLGDLGLDIEVDSDGNVEAFGLLPEGTHAVRLRAVDTDGKEDTDSVVINVGPANSAPECAITAPEDGSAGPEGAEVRFEGTATDVDIASDALTATWESDKDGPLGESTPTSDGYIGFAMADLTANTHRITLTVTDELGATCSRGIFYTVGTPPVVNITAPADGAVVNARDTLVFSAEVSDAEDMPTDIALQWEIDGETLSEARADSSGRASFTLDGWSGSGTHVLTLTATDTDGLYVTDSITLTFNRPPTAPSVTINPDPATTENTLFAVATGSVDPDESGSVTYRYAWFADGVEIPDVTGASFPADRTIKHHTYRVEVIASDGLHEGPAGTAERTVQNTAPELTSVTVTPDSGPSGTTLTCVGTIEDADGDGVSLAYLWSDGTASDTVVIGDDAPVGSTLTCTATADDGDGGTASDAAFATVTNTAPVMGDVRITPDNGQVGDVLTCSASATDEDGDALTYTYMWSGAAATDGPTYTITAADRPGTEIICMARATDPSDAAIEGAATARVVNTDPVVTATVSPDTATVGATLTCTAIASDVNGDVPTLTYAWSDGSTGTSYTISAADDPGDTLTCTATAADVDGGSAASEASATVANTDPVVVSVTIDAASGAVGDTLTCSATATDADGEAPTLTYAWSTGTVGASHTITASDASGGTLTCTATASDTDGGSATGTATATVDNTGPVITGVSISPADPNNDNTLTCAATATDADGEAPTITYTWSTGASGAMLALTSATRPGDEVSCTAIATDASGATDAETTGVTVVNRVPTAGSVTISPTSPKADETVTCGAAGAVDPDGEGVTLTYAWEINDAPAGTSSALSSGYGGGDELTCTVTATDESGSSASASARTTVGNTAPVVTSVVLSPATVYTNDTLTATATTTDIDGDALTMEYTFFVDGEVVQESSSNTLDGTVYFDRDQTVRVYATANDGAVTHTEMSDFVTIANSAPTAPVVEITRDDCPVGWTALDSGDRCVAVFEGDALSWFDAEENCGDYGGHLARVASLDDNDTLYDLADGISLESIWIGLNDQFSEGAWEWSDGGSTDYENWRVGEPGGSTSEEDCVALLHNSSTDSYAGKWVDESCDSAGWVGGYACQVSIGSSEHSLVFSDTREAYLRVSDHGLPAGNDPRSFSIWFKSDASWSNGNLFSYGVANHSTIGRRFSLFVNWSGADSPTNIHVAGQSFDHFMGDVPYTANEWQHAVVTHDGSTLKLYVQGVLRGERTGLIFSTEVGTDFNIGMNTTDRFDEWYEGSIADLRAWNRALSATEVNELYAGADVDSGMIAHWDFAEGSGSMTREALGTGWDAEFMTRASTLPTWSTDIPTAVEGEDPPLHCSIVEESTDADGDSITYTFDWDVDGVEYTETTTLVYDGDAVAGDALAEDETWTCEVTPDDGERVGPMAESSIYNSL